MANRRQKKKKEKLGQTQQNNMWIKPTAEPQQAAPAPGNGWHKPGQNDASTPPRPNGWVKVEQTPAKPEAASSGWVQPAPGQTPQAKQAKAPAPKKKPAPAAKAPARRPAAGPARAEAAKPAGQKEVYRQQAAGGTVPPKPAAEAAQQPAAAQAQPTPVQGKEQQRPAAAQAGGENKKPPSLAVAGKVKKPDMAPQNAGLAEPAKPQKKRRRRKRSVAGVMLASAFKLLFVLGCMVVIALSIAAVQVSLYMAEATADDDTMLDLESLKLNQTSYFMALNPENPNALEENDWIEYQELVGPEHRIWVPLEKIPQDLRNAVFAIEDREFLNHHGVDIKRTLYAIANEFLGLTDRSFGASTIEQQLIKNITKEDESEGESGYQRKMREMFRAWGLNNKYTKNTILEAYLNTISLSGTIAGVQAGALEYFDKDVSELELHECAMIAGVTRAPGTYDPYLNPQTCKNRRDSVLEQMYKNGFITEKQYQEAVAKPLGLVRSQQSKYSDDSIYSYFSDQAFDEVVQALMDHYNISSQEATNRLYTGGYRVRLTVDLNVQKPLEQMYYYGYEEDGFFTALRDNRGRYYKNVLTLIKEGDDGEPQEILPQSAVAIVDYNGALVGVVGGIGPKDKNLTLNRATQSPRQVGSCMKPIAAYALGIDMGLVDYSSMIVDSGVRYKNGKGAVDPETGEPRYDWPRNVTNTYRNTPIPVVSAIAESTNTVAVKVGMRVGVEEMYDFLVNTLQLEHLVGEGSHSDLDYGPLVLGSLTNGITAYELASAYMMFGNGGQFNSRHAFTEIYDSNGNLVLEAKCTSVQAISPETAYVMNRLLSTVVHGAPGVRATAIGFAPEGGDMDSVAKTGTTSDNKDRWIVGLTPYYVTAVWWGYDKPETIKWSTGSSNVHPRVWKTIMDEVQEGMPYKDFPEMPEGVSIEQFCTTSGELAGPNCSGRQMGYYTSLRVPTTCTLHSGAVELPPEAPAA